MEGDFFSVFMKIEDIQQEIIEEFQDYDDWMDRYQLIIDLGQDQTFTGFQYLPRAEAGAPESIKHYRIYVKSESFKF